MAIQSKAYPIVENAINLFGDWLKRRQEMRELRDMSSGDFARIARDLSMSPAELDAVVRQGPHASDELPRLLDRGRLGTLRLGPRGADEDVLEGLDRLGNAVFEDLEVLP